MSKCCLCKKEIGIITVGESLIPEDEFDEKYRYEKICGGCYCLVLSHGDIFPDEITVGNIEINEK